jgi:imidazolonepropionase-like amidohydrolase
MKSLLTPALACALFLAPASAALAQEGSAEGSTLQFRAREIWTADGQRVANALLVVEGGKVRAVGADQEADPRLPLIAHDGVISAGLVACQTQSGAAGELLDDTRSVLPEARTLHAFAPEHPDFERALAAGITTLVLPPSPENLVGGLACAVKSAGGSVLSAEASLALSFSSAALGRSTATGFFFFGAAEELASADGSPEVTERSRRGTREPTSYAGALAQLRALLAGKSGPFARAAAGELPVVLDAWDRHEVLRAAGFAREHGLRGALRGAPLAGDPDVLAAIQASGLGVILGPFAGDQARRSLESVKLLGAAGVPVAFALDAPLHAPAELRLTAARALWAGASRETAWKALTSDAALLAGVGERVGTLTNGKDADFVLWSGDPLDLRSRVEAVYVDGVSRWRAPRPEKKQEPKR